MKFLPIVAAGIALTGCSAVQQSNFHKQIEHSVYMLSAVDMLTTAEIKSSPNHYEMNPVLGEQPDPRVIYPYFIGSMTVFYLANKKLDDWGMHKTRAAFNTICFLTELWCATNNSGKGLRNDIDWLVQFRINFGG